jgi:hypothetical protein
MGDFETEHVFDAYASVCVTINGTIIVSVVNWQRRSDGSVRIKDVQLGDVYGPELVERGTSEVFV